MSGIITGSLVYDLAVILVALIVVTVAFFKWMFTYWEKKGVPTLNPVVFFGDTKDLILKKRSFGEQFVDIYNEFKARGFKHGGVYMMHKPVYVPIDPEAIKNVIQRDFQHFVSHGIFVNEKDDPLSAHLFNLEEEKWKNMRVKLTPTFTSGKMKMMFQTLVDCTGGLKDIMDDFVNKKEAVDIKDVLGRFTTDIIGSCAFGLECNSLKDPDTEFRKYGKKTFETTALDRLKEIANFVLPFEVLQFIGLRFIKRDVEEFYMNVINATVDYREKNNIYRKDFMHLLLQLKNRGKVDDGEKIVDDNGECSEKAMTMAELAAQAFVFFAAGFETSSTTMTFALYELATNPHIQEKLRDEINTVLVKHDNKITYDAVMEMTYMDRVVNETLRKYPPVPFLPRKCTKDYVVPGTTANIEKGTAVFIPVLGIHKDPEYYPDPERFDPDRFTEENKSKRPAFTWLPFGEGPRMCIGLRFGVMQSKVGLTALLRSYRIEVNKKTKTPITMEKESFILTTEGGIWLNVAKWER